MEGSRAQHCQDVARDLAYSLHAAVGMFGQYQLRQTPGQSSKECVQINVDSLVWVFSGSENVDFVIFLCLEKMLTSKL